MEAQYDNPEIVRILTGFRLIDAESYERSYLRRDSLPLAPGYYIVSWPDGSARRRFDEEATFSGPFKEIQNARSALGLLKPWAEALRIFQGALRGGSTEIRKQTA